jgi:hypothetical protein
LQTDGPRRSLNPQERDEQTPERPFAMPQRRHAASDETSNRDSSRAVAAGNNEDATGTPQRVRASPLIHPVTTVLLSYFSFAAARTFLRPVLTTESAFAEVGPFW